MPKQPTQLPLLPPQIDLTPIIGLLTEARDAIARYDEVVKRLPNPSLIRRTFETQEAVLSSRIEGTQATVEDVLELDVEDGQAEKSEKQRDYREIANYRAMIDYGRELLRTKPLDENVIKEIHRGLLNSARGRNKNPGHFRIHQVHIGPPGATIEEASYVPPMFTEVPRLFSNMVRYIHDERQPDILIQAAIMHYQFEAIHPFADGNGRIGRILIPLYLYEKGITTYPNLYISEFLEAHRRYYYERLNAVSEKDEWHEWITFFLRAAREQARLSKERVEEIEILHKDLHERLPQFNSIYAAAFLEALFRSPIFTPLSIGKAANIQSAQTIYNLVAKFAEAKLIADLTPDKERGKVYSFEPLLAIL